MDIRHSINLLTTTVFAIFCLLGVITCHTLTASVAQAPVAVYGTVELTYPENEFGGEYTTGKKLWNINGCGACHAKSMRTDATGPALGGVVSRWADHPRADLYAWVRNSGKLVAAGHPRAVEVYTEWNGATMNNFPDLSDEDVENLLAYIEGQYGG